MIFASSEGWGILTVFSLAIVYIVLPVANDWYYRTRR
jgi:hypothetical protein